MTTASNDLQKRLDALEAENHRLRRDNEVIADSFRSVTERYQTLVDNLGIGVYSLSDPIKGTLGSGNPAVARIFGYDSVEEILALGTSFMLYEDPEERVRFVQKLLDNEFKASHTITFEVGLLKKDRTPIRVRIVAHGTFDGDNKLVRVDGAVEDVTGQRMAEEALRESEHRFRKVFETAAVGIVICSRDGRMVKVNPAFCEFIGYGPEELHARTMLDITHPDHRKESIARMRKLKESPSVALEGEKRYLHKDGRAIWGQIRATNFIDVQGEAVNSVVIVQDITERKLVEGDLLRIQKLESLAVLAGGIAHDFNNILTGVLGNVSLARVIAEGNPKLQDRLARAEHAATRARDLTLQLQTFARGGEPDRRAAFIGDIVSEAADFCLRGSKVRCEVSAESSPWPAEVDPGQIGQVFSNLLINAQQAMPEGGTVEVRTENVVVDPGSLLPLGPGRYVRVIVADGGIGIPEDELDQIFDPYFTTKATGSGLGLATSYSIIRKHGGHITVDSAVTAGTRFAVYLPAAAAGVVPLVEGRVQAEPASGSGRILLMDDEAIVAETDRSILENFGYEVVTVLDGGDVLPRYRAARASGRPFDLVIMDLTVPGGHGGAEVIGALRRYDPAVRALVSSGYSTNPVMAEFERWGFRAALPKPHTARELLQAVRSVIEAD